MQCEARSQIYQEIARNAPPPRRGEAGSKDFSQKM